MARDRIKLNSREIQSYLDGAHGVEQELDAKAQGAAEDIRANAVVVSGNYRDNVKVVTEHTDRMVKRVVVDVPYALQVEAAHGTIARGLDGAR